MPEAKADIGLIGLAVMGQNLVLNMNDKGFAVAVFNRTVSKVDDFLGGPAAGRGTIVGTHSIEEFVAALKRPRRAMLLVKAGRSGDRHHVRRALTAEEVARLLHAARIRPIAELGRESQLLPHDKKANRNTWTYEPLTADNLHACYGRGWRVSRSRRRGGASLRNLGGTGRRSTCWRS